MKINLSFVSSRFQSEIEEGKLQTPEPEMAGNREVKKRGFYEEEVGSK